MKPKATIQVRPATLSGLLALVLLGSAAVAMAAAPTPRPVADVNCDGRGTAADFCAAIIVSGDATQFPACAAADPFRGQPLTAQDFLPILHDIFDTFSARWTPTITASPTITPNATVTATPTRTLQMQASPTESPTASPSATPTPTKTATETPTPTPRPTSSPTRSASSTQSPSPTPTPTGVAFQLSGNWYAAWTGQICYLAGQPFTSLTPTTYRVSALQGRLDIQIVVSEVYLGRGLTLDANNTVQTTYSVFDPDPNHNCFGVQPQYVFNYTFTFAANGTGTASVEWTYGLNTNCALCTVDDTALLTRIAGPGS